MPFYRVVADNACLVVTDIDVGQREMSSPLGERDLSSDSSERDLSSSDSDDDEEETEGEVEEEAEEAEEEGEDEDVVMDVKEEQGTDADESSNSAASATAPLVTFETQNEVLSCAAPDMGEGNSGDGGGARAILRVEDYQPRSETERCVDPATNDPSISILHSYGMLTVNVSHL